MSSNQPSFKLPVGIDKDTGSLLRIDEVRRGLGCNCLCPGCETPLVARKGELKAHHFAHHTPPPESTLSCAESALHKWAKNIVAKQRTWSLRAEHFVPKAWTARLGETLASHDEWWSPFSDNSFIIENTMEEHDFGDWNAYSGEREHPYRLNVNTSFLNASPTGVCTPGVHVQSIS